MTTTHVHLDLQQIDWLLSQIQVSDPYKLCRLLTAARHILTDDAERLREIAARSSSNQHWEERQQSNIAKDTRREIKVSKRAKKFIDFAESLSEPEMQALLALARRNS